MSSVYNSQLDAFDLYHLVHEPTEVAIATVAQSALPALGHALTGSLGAAVSNVTTYPLALISTRLQVQNQLESVAPAQSSGESGSIAETAKHIYAKDGLRGLFSGLEADSVKTVADAFLFFLSYTYLRQSRSRLKKNPKSLSILDELSVGFIAGAFSKFLTTPITNIVTRKQTGRVTSANKDVNDDNTTARSIAEGILREKGLPGFWSGYSASLILTLNPTLTFFLFETLKRLSLPSGERSHPSARAIFLFAAMSKAIASAITYPFSLAKTRLQIGGKASDAETDGSSDEAKRKLAGQFHIVSRIVQQEGVGGLYEGLSAEILKGFFNHGFTMLTKTSIHKVILGLYFAIVKLWSQNRLMRGRVRAH